MLVQLVVTGLALGSMYGLVALGYHITWVTSRTMNFSQGHVVMAGAVVAYAVHVAAGWPLGAALAVTLAAAAVFGLLVERVAVRPFFRSGSPVWLLATIALGIIAENVAMVTFGRDARAFPSALALKPVFVAGAGVYPQELLLPVVGLALMGGVQLFYHRTFHGRQLKAVAWNSEAAALMGIHVPRAVAAAYVLSSLLAAVAGVLLAPLLNVSPTMGTLIGLKAFAVAIIGGLDSAAGIVIAGLAYGLVESFTAGYVSTGAREIVGFAVVIAMLVVRPWGLLGARPARRV
ncbi:MAG TPA: branched-chain amino acid ABC transporter permease [Candidatus Tectomicrobia bacterium]|nr:branched-chain amino acid ABC transporter permease [Candidatus Tectomicrobia bacterium]